MTHAITNTITIHIHTLLMYTVPDNVYAFFCEMVEFLLTFAILPIFVVHILRRR